MENSWVERFGVLLHTSRVDAGLSQEEVARGVGLSLLGYCNIERGRSEPRARTFLRIMKFLSIDLDDLPC